MKTSLPEIAKLPKSTMRPSPAQTIACFYCGNNNPWFQCHCWRAEEARNGKRIKPKFIPADKSPTGKPVYILDPEALENSWLAKQCKMPRYVPPNEPLTPPVTPSPTTVTPDPVTPVTDAPTVTLTVTASVTPASHADRQRRYRQRQRDKPKP